MPNYCCFILGRKELLDGVSRSIYPLLFLLLILIDRLTPTVTTFYKPAGYVAKKPIYTSM